MRTRDECNCDCDGLDHATERAPPLMAIEILEGQLGYGWLLSETALHTPLYCALCVHHLQPTFANESTAAFAAITLACPQANHQRKWPLILPCSVVLANTSTCPRNTAIT